MFIRNDFFIDKIISEKEIWICWKYRTGSPALAGTRYKNLTTPVTVASRKALLTSDSDPVGSDLGDFGYLTSIKNLDKSCPYNKPFIQELSQHLKG